MLIYAFFLAINYGCLHFMGACMGGAWWGGDGGGIQTVPRGCLDSIDRYYYTLLVVCLC